jgi:tellurite resistance protein
MSAPDKGLLDRVARGISRPGQAAPPGITASILAQAATSYGARPVYDESTAPTGFDPKAAALFEGIVEAAFLVANADGTFDADERAAFQLVVTTACNDQVQPTQLTALLADLTKQLIEDGIERRARMVARSITRPDHQMEVLRIAALMAHISGGVDSSERDVLDHLARGFDLPSDAVDRALAEAKAALATMGGPESGLVTMGGPESPPKPPQSPR